MVCWSTSLSMRDMVFKEICRNEDSDLFEDQINGCKGRFGDADISENRKSYSLEPAAQELRESSCFPMRIKRCSACEMY